MRAGIVADGVFKLTFGAAYLIACVSLACALRVSLWIIVLSGIAVTLVGASEARLASRRTTRVFLVSLALYDGIWVLVTVAALLLAYAGGPFGGELWLGYQIVAAATLTATLLIGVGRVA